MINSVRKGRNSVTYRVTKNTPYDPKAFSHDRLILSVSILCNSDLLMQSVEEAKLNMKTQELIQSDPHQLC